MKTKLEIWQQLADQGIHNINNLFYNLSTPALYEQAVRRREALVAEDGPLVVRTGQHTGRSPNDKFIVRESSSEKYVWWGKINKPLDERYFERIHNHMLSYVMSKDLYVLDTFVGTDPRYRLPIRVITETAWHSLFSENLFITPTAEELQNHYPEFTVINMPYFQADPEVDGTSSGLFVIINFEKKLVLIGGTSYAGEIKKSIFTVMNYLMPLKNVMSMHCSANIGEKGDVSILFGLSGTGKTTLSADPKRKLIGDDEHGWSDDGVFNFEGGCYAKVIKLSPEAEPDIYATTHRFGTVLENVAMDIYQRKLDLDDESLTENTRAAYPITFIRNIILSGMAGHPKNVVMLTADAFGVLPPIAKLSPDQAMYHFLSGYTAKVAGTEKGVTEPKATFSTCFGAPFLVHFPSVYANLLGEKIRKHNVNCWLVNTGWTGGGYGEGTRMKISYTRAMLNAALNGELDGVAVVVDPFFGIRVPQAIKGIPAEILNPRNTWKDKLKYDEAARRLVNMFHENFKYFEADTSEAIKNSGPKKL